MLNAYEVLHSNSIAERVRSEGVHRYMKFEGLIAMDSGGYLFMRRQEVNITPEAILSLYEEVKPDFGVVLDHPLTPNLPQKDAERRLLVTLENTNRH